MNYTELKEAAREKLNSEGYEAKILVSLPEAPFSPTSDKNMNYGIAYGGILCPLSIEPYIKQATSEKDYGELVSWLASHGGRINFDFLNTGERYTQKWIKKHQKMAKEAGIYLSDDNAVLMLGVTLEPDADMIFSRENFPDLYEKIEYVLQAYLDGKMKLVLD